MKRTNEEVMRRHGTLRERRGAIWNFHTMSTIRERRMKGEQRGTEVLNGEKKEWRD